MNHMNVTAHCSNLHVIEADNIYLLASCFTVVELCWQWAGPTSQPSESQRSGPSMDRQSPFMWVLMWLTHQLQSVYSIHYSDIHLDTYINWQILWNRPLCVQQHISKTLLLCAAEGGRQFVSECCSRLLVQQLQLQTSNATPGHKDFQMSPHCAEFYRKKRDSIRGYACFIWKAEEFCPFY